MDIYSLALVFLNGLTQPLWNTDPTVCFKISMSSVRANILVTFQEKRLAHETKCSVEKLRIWWVYWKLSSRRLTKTWIFFSQFTSVPFPSQAPPNTMGSQSPTEELRKLKAALGFWGAYFGLQLQKPLQWQYLTAPQVEYSRIFGCTFNKKHENFL